MINKRNKKQVIAYLHTHWDREWYREFEVFRLRLLRVFDNVINLLKSEAIPSFYFDGQVSALLDYLELRPENEQIIRDLIKQKKLYIGPFFCLVDEFLTDGICFRKNLEIGLKIANDFGCEDYVAYFADTFGHSKNIPLILKEFGIDKAIVWRGVGDLPAEFLFDGVKTVQLMRGYFMDIFSTDKTVEEKAEFLKKNLDMIAEGSGNTLLLPIGADHLGVPNDISQQIEAVNELLEDYEIHIGSIFEYFDKVKFRKKYNNELRDNSKTFILQGAYSARTKLKQLNTEASYKLDLANKIQYNFGNKYTKPIEYAYKLLLCNQAHDSICGCSTDKTAQECITRYNKVLEISDTIIREVKQSLPNNLSATFKNFDKYKILEIERDKIEDGCQVIALKEGFDSNLMHDTMRIPVTEDLKPIYTLLKEFNIDNKDKLLVSDTKLSNSNTKIEVINGKINVSFDEQIYENFIEFVRYKDKGDAYNFAPDLKDEGEVAEILSARKLYDGPLRCAIKIETSFFSVVVFLNKNSKLLNFSISWNNFMTNHIWQVRFNLNNNIYETWSEDMNLLVKREFDPEYNMRDNLPDEKGHEVKTNFAPMQRFVWANGIGIITKGLTEYEVFENTLSVTLLRSIGIISKPDNPARTTPAGPPIKIPEAQQLGENTAEFAVGMFDINEWDNMVEEIYPQTVIF